MNQPITMPVLSDTMNNGRLVKWTRKIGDPIKRGDSIADVETDKAVMDIEAFHDGYLAGPLAEEGAELPVGATIGYIAESPGAASAASAVSAAPPAVPPTPGVAAPSHPSEPPSGPTAPTAARPAMARARVSPYARRLAQQKGVGATPVITLSEGIHAGPPYRLERASSVREALARNMTASLAIPTFHMTARLTLAPLLVLSKDSSLSLTLLLARACALTIKAHGLFNAKYTPEGLAFRERVDVAIAVDTLRGLVAPVIRDVAGRPLAELAADWRNLHEKALGCGLRVEDYQEATFYLSNLGMYSVVHSFDAVLPVGAAAILCVAAADGDRTSFTLVCDHRVVAGADAARFLKTLDEYLANPDRLAEMPHPMGFST